MSNCRVRQGGHEVRLDLDVQPLRDARGALSGFTQIGTDVTTQRRNRLRLEGALRKNDALLRVLHPHAIVSVAGRAGGIIKAIDAFCHASDYSCAELLHGTHCIVKSIVKFGVQPPSLFYLTALLPAAPAAGKRWSLVCDWPVKR